ncbi:MAG: UDP-3-O-[3-hydroxymyristoyl] N-acetylglucosamine deacetylase [Candidatus Azotimanducaceae bacterium]|jgi:UDP-3-O-[3-hydroxymyristoyl] N-acetylglucosamine deacetylase|tara:strand:- start:21471 stop:22391 length:921 start_codon:yes stop_codon:yes gene_type:complete
MFRQRTIKSPVHAIGIGVHSGAKVRMSLRPAKAGSGIQFVRADIDGPNSVLACAESVSDTALSTTISRGPINVATVEHLMSALWGLGIDNLVIELSAEEVPIMDGSAAPFIDMINSVGILELDEAKQFIRINREISVSQGEATASLQPYAGFKAGYTFVANHAVFNRYPKYAELDFATTSYENAVSGARSFGLLEELPHAQAINKCLGSSLENAVGIDDHSVVNEGGLRYHDEFVKHKLLDAIGDLYLLGRPILGAFNGYMSGHALNNKLARALLRCDDAWDVVSYNLDDQANPHEILVKQAAVAE